MLNLLTEQERAWLRDHPVITVAHDPDWAPVEFSDERGELTGISGDYLNLVEQRLGVKFNRIPNLSWQEAFSRQKRWEIDMATCVAASSGRSDFWAFTKPYLSIPIVIATHDDVGYIGNMKELFGKKVAVVKNYAIDEWVTHDFPEINLSRVNTVPEGLAALQRGEVFAYLDNLLIIGDYQVKLKVSNIKIAGQTPYMNAQRMAVRKDWAPLAGILDKALDSISEAERQEIYRKWVPIRYEHGFDYALLWQALGIFAVMLLGLALWIRKLTKEIKQRKAAEQQLKEQEQRLRLVTGNMMDAISQVNTDRVVVYCSPSVEQVFGIKPESLIGRNAYERVHPDDLERVRQQALEAVASRAAALRIEYRYLHGRGEYVWVESAIRLLFGENGEYAGVVIGSRDVTERKRAEEGLRESEERLRLAMKGANQGIYDLNVQTGETQVSPEYATMLGYDPATFHETNAAWIDRLHPEDHEPVAAIYRDYISGRIPEYRVEFRQRVKSGDWKWILSLGKIVEWDAAGQPLRMLGTHTDITERKQAEAALRERTEELDRFFATTLDLLCIADTDGFFRRLNPQWETVLGYSLAELEGKRFPDLIHPDDVEATVQEVSRLDAQQPVLNFVNRYRCRDGSYRWFEWRSSPRGKLIYAAARDITDRKRAGEALRDSEENYRTLIQKIQVAVVVHGPDTRILTCNSMAQELLGLTEDQLLGKTVIDKTWHFFNADGTKMGVDEYPVNQVIARSRALRNLITGVHRPNKDPENDVWVLVNADPVFVNDEIVKVIVTFIDISDRMRAEEALRESEKKYQSLFDNAQVALFRTGISDGKLLEINERYAKMAGYSNVDDCMAEFNSADAWTDPDARIDLRRILSEKGFVTDYETEIIRRDGNRIWILFSATIFPEQGFIEGSIIDITERKKAETALQSSLAEKDSLLKEVHHRVKNNLQVISSLLSLQFRHVKNDEVRSFLRDTQNRIRSMAMLHEILYHSENKARINFPQYVKDLCAQLARSLGSKARNISLRQEIAPVALNLDQAVTAGLIINELVTNAFKHAFPSRSEGKILVELHAPDEHHLLLRVSDNGIGFPPESPLQRSESLGLLLVKNLSRQLEGRLSVTGSAGTVFEIIFPHNPLER
jgi:PAS domain S-box-containing protein